MNLIYQTGHESEPKETDELQEYESKLKLTFDKLQIFLVIGCFIFSGILAILLFFILKINGEYIATIYFGSPTFGLIFNLLFVLTVLFATLGWIAKIEIAKKFFVLLIIFWIGFILMYIFSKLPIGKKIISSINSFLSISFNYIRRSLCYLKPENVAAGIFEECEIDVEKEGEYKNLEVVFGIISGGNVEDTNPQPIAGKPYKLDMTLTNLNQKSKAVFQKSIYDIKVKNIDGYASPYPFDSIDFYDYNAPRPNAKYDKEFTIEAGDSKWIRLEFNELPCCFGVMYFHTRVTTNQIGNGKSTIGIVPFSIENERDKYRNFLDSFEKIDLSSPGPINIKILANPRIISKKDLGSDTFKTILKVINNLDEGPTKLFKSRIILPFDYLDITRCSSSYGVDINFNRCADVNNCIEIELDDQPVIKNYEAFDIECETRILENKYKEYYTTGYISAEVYYEYIIESDYQKFAYCKNCIVTTSPTTSTILTGSTISGNYYSCKRGGTPGCPNNPCIINKMKNGVPYPPCNNNIKITNTDPSNENSCDSPACMYEFIHDPSRSYLNVYDTDQYIRSLLQQEIESQLEQINFLGLNIRVNKKIVPKLREVENDLNKYNHQGSTYYFPSGVYTFTLYGGGGAYNFRENVNNPTVLSSHAFGLAIDLNVKNNWGNVLDSDPCNNPTCQIDMPPEVVEIFERHGFRWGGRFWCRFDPMHFEYIESCIV